MNKLITITPVFLALLIGGCSYGSLYEAEQACSEWSEQVGFYRHIWLDGDDKLVFETPIRRCSREELTKQVLGLTIAHKLDDWGELESEERYPSRKVVKRFRY